MIKRIVLAFIEYNRKCKECKIKIELSDNLCPSDAKRRKFCSRSCAAKYNNKKNAKRTKDVEKTTCQLCGGWKSYGAKTCHACKRAISLRAAWEKPMSDYFINTASRAKFNSVRKWARVYMNEHDTRVKKCEICGYDNIVEVAHKRPISSFSDEALMKEVNSKENLLWLCPNHHAEFDEGIIIIK